MPISRSSRYATSRARIHGWLIVTALAAAAVAPGATASRPAGQLAATRAGTPVTSKALYLANASVLVTHDDTKVVFDPLFDPLFRNDFGQYALPEFELLEQASEDIRFFGRRAVVTCSTRCFAIAYAISNENNTVSIVEPR